MVSLSLLNDCNVQSRTKIMSKKMLLLPSILITMIETEVELMRKWRNSSKESP